MITDAEWTQCESCSDTWFDEDGNVTHEKPHRHSINSEPGVCPQCITTLRRLGFSDERIFGTLSGGNTDGEVSRMCGAVVSIGPVQDQQSLGSNPKPVQFRPAAQINFQHAA